MIEQLNLIQKKSEVWRESFLKPLLRHIRFTGNDITTFRLLLALSFPFLILRFPLLAWLFIFTSFSLDALDGPVARFKNTDSDRGKFIDVLIDQITFILLILGLIRLFPDLSQVLTTLGFIIPLTYLITIIYKNEKSSSDWIIKPKTQLTIYKIIFIIIIISYLTQVLSKEIVWLLLWLEAITAGFHFGIYYVAFINKDTSSPSHTK
jgi:phosphatidylglycerophosphate synthase